MSICGCDAVQVETVASLIEEHGETFISDLFTGLEMADSWTMFRDYYLHRMIGSCDVDRWAAAVKAQAKVVDAFYAQRKAIYDVEGLTSTVTSKRTLTESVDTTMSDTVDHEREDIPETAEAMDSKYLSERSLSDRDVIGKTERTLSDTATDGLPLEIAERQIRALRSIELEWAQEFQRLFLRMW